MSDHYVLLSGALLWAVRIERRLERIASDAARRGEPLPQADHALAPLYARLGLAATAALLAVVFVMVAKRPLV